MTNKFKVNDEVIHLKSGGQYTITGEPEDYAIEATREPAYAYRMRIGTTHVGPNWIRAATVMEDGRFVKVEPGIN